MDGAVDCAWEATSCHSNSTYGTQQEDWTQTAHAGSTSMSRRHITFAVAAVASRRCGSDGHSGCGLIWDRGLLAKFAESPWVVAVVVRLRCARLAAGVKSSALDVTGGVGLPVEVRVVVGVQRLKQLARLLAPLHTRDEQQGHAVLRMGLAPVLHAEREERGAVCGRRDTHTSTALLSALSLPRSIRPRLAAPARQCKPMLRPSKTAGWVGAGISRRSKSFSSSPLTNSDSSSLQA